MTHLANIVAAGALIITGLALVLAFALVVWWAVQDMRKGKL